MLAKVMGGKNLKEIINAYKDKVTYRLEFGYFPDARYDDDEKTPVAAVAFRNEYGVSREVPSRPFFKNANRLLAKEVPTIAKSQHSLNNDFMQIVGKRALFNLKASILGKGYQYVPNSDKTIALKGHDIQLIDTGRMFRSGKYTITKL